MDVTFSAMELNLKACNGGGYSSHNRVLKDRETENWTENDSAVFFVFLEHLFHRTKGASTAAAPPAGMRSENIY